MTQSRRIEECPHKETISTVTAGLERTVCEACGHVSVAYIEPTVQLYPELLDMELPLMRATVSAAGKQVLCGVCEAPAEFLIPGGMGCADHAWKEASLQQIMGTEPWIPISIDQRTNAG